MILERGGGAGELAGRTPLILALIFTFLVSERPLRTLHFATAHFVIGEFFEVRPQSSQFPTLFVNGISATNSSLVKPNQLAAPMVAYFHTVNSENHMYMIFFQ